MFNKNILSLAKSNFDYMREIRRKLHQNPELAFEEKETSKLIAEKLREIDIDIEKKVGQTGVIAKLNEGASGPTILPRSDMDALPIQEENKVEYASKQEGIMHACGHDAHVAIGLGTAKILKEIEDKLSAEVIIAFQPAEETDEGAKAMLKSDKTENLSYDAVLGLHIDPQLPPKTIGIRSGPTMASIDHLNVKIIGESSHAATPHLSKDPITSAAAFILELNSFLNRRYNPIKAKNVGFGRIEGGTTRNIIPSKVELEGDIRSLDPETREKLLEKTQEVGKGIEEIYGVKAEVEVKRKIPPVVNSRKICQIVKNAAIKLLDEDAVKAVDPMLGGDDFGVWSEDTLSCYFWLGANDGRKTGLHHSNFDIEEKAMVYGSAILTQAIMDTGQIEL